MNRLDTLREKLDALSEEALVAAAEYENLQNDIDREEAKIAEGYTRMQESAMGVERLRGQILEIEQNSAAVKADIAVSEMIFSTAGRRLPRRRKAMRQSSFPEQS